jgi:thiol-disulfide isomerase/thioredoxin
VRRRAGLVGGVALAAALGGIGWRAWERRGNLSAGDASAGLWQMRFERPAGGTLDMAALRGQRVLLNFWATWCPPCIEEMPELDAFHQRHAAAGWQVVGLAVDQPAAVRAFLARSPVHYPVGLAGVEGAELSRRLGNERAGLPFSVVFTRDGQPAARKLGETRPELLAAWAAKY